MIDLLAERIGRALPEGPPPTEILSATTPDGWRLPVRRFAPPRGTARRGPPVILAPGLGGNHVAFDLDPERSLAHALTRRGHEVFVATFRGARATTPPPGADPHEVTLEALATRDAPAVLDLVLRDTGASSAAWVGHSLGGLIGLHVATSPRARDVGVLVTLGAPLRFRRPALRRWLGRAVVLADLLARGRRLPMAALARLEAPLMGRLPIPHALSFVSPPGLDPDLTRRLHAHGVEDLPGPLLRELLGWCEDDRWLIDRVGALRRPARFLSGTRDPWAPPGPTGAALRAVRMPRECLVPVGRRFGQRVDYGHVALVAGSHAPAEIFPLVAAAIEGLAA